MTARKLAAAVAAIISGLATPAWAEVEVQTFTAGTPARAADVNQNFANVKRVVELSERRIAALQERIDDLEASLSTVIALNDVLRIEAINGVRTVQLSGVNFQVVNGMNFTDGINGAGNIIIGYNEENRLTDQFYCSIGLGENNLSTEDTAGCSQAGGVFAPIHKSGSHNLVMGSQNNYSSTAGIVAGKNNTINFRFASVLGGVRNRATGFLSTVVGGQENLALGNSSSVSGGNFIQATAQHATVGGGRRNVASGAASSVSGGETGNASGNAAAISGGTANTASGFFASVSGGTGNTASANQSSILGGRNQSLAVNAGTLPVGP